MWPLNLLQPHANCFCRITFVLHFMFMILDFYQALAGIAWLIIKTTIVVQCFMCKPVWRHKNVCVDTESEVCNKSGLLGRQLTGVLIEGASGISCSCSCVVKLRLHAAPLGFLTLLPLVIRQQKQLLNEQTLTLCVVCKASPTTRWALEKLSVLQAFKKCP